MQYSYKALPSHSFVRCNTTPAMLVFDLDQTQFPLGSRQSGKLEKLLRLFLTEQRPCSSFCDGDFQKRAAL